METITDFLYWVMARYSELSMDIRLFNPFHKQEISLRKDQKSDK